MSAVMENIVFLPSTGQLAMHNFFLQKICLQWYQQKKKEQT